MKQFLLALGYETDVRVRVRGRIVSVHRKRGQIRVVGVVATPETTDRTVHCSRHISEETSLQPSHSVATITSRGYHAGHRILCHLARKRCFSPYSSSALRLFRCAAALTPRIIPFKYPTTAGVGRASPPFPFSLSRCAWVIPTHVYDCATDISDVSTSTQVPKPKAEYETAGEL